MPVETSMTIPTPPASEVSLGRTLTTASTRQVVYGTLVVVAVGLSFWLLYEFRLAAFSLFVAIVISTAIRPAVEWLYLKQIPRALGVTLIGLVLLGLALGLVLWVAPLVVEQATTLSVGLSGYYASFVAFLRNSSSLLVQRLAWQLPASLPLVPAAPANGEALDLVPQALAYVSSFGHGLFLLIAILWLAFYWTLERERTLKFLLLLAPLEQRESLRELVDTIEFKVGAYIRGIALLSLIVGGLTLVIYLGLGLPSALVLALVAGVMEAIPLVGPTLGAIPAVFMALAYDPSKAVWVVVAAALIQFVENIFLVPRVMGRAVGVNTVMTLLALAAASALFGPMGAFLAVPAAAILQLLWDRYVLNSPAPAAELSNGRDYISVLRVEAQELVQDVRKQVRQKPEALTEANDEVEDTIETLANELDSILAQASLQREQQDPRQPAHAAPLP